MGFWRMIEITCRGAALELSWYFVFGLQLHEIAQTYLILLCI